MNSHLRRTDRSRHLVADLLSLLEGPADAGAAAMAPDERAALFAAAHDYADLVPETCTRCERPLPYLSPEDPSEFSYDRGLRMIATGGYGMFIDPFVEGDPEILLCHECAHAVCAALPWLAAAIGAPFGHSDGSTADPAETAGWPTIEEAAAILHRKPESLVAHIDPAVAARDGVSRLRPAVVIELARARRDVSDYEAGGALEVLAAGRVSDEAYEAIDAEIQAAFVGTPSTIDDPAGETAALLAAIRRRDPRWADELEAIYRRAGARLGEADASEPPAA